MSVIHWESLKVGANIFLEKKTEVWCVMCTLSWICLCDLINVKFPVCRYTWLLVGKRRRGIPRCHSSLDHLSSHECILCIEIHTPACSIFLKLPRSQRSRCPQVQTLSHTHAHAHSTKVLYFKWTSIKRQGTPLSLGMNESMGALQNI